MFKKALFNIIMITLCYSAADSRQELEQNICGDWITLHPFNQMIIETKPHLESLYAHFPKIVEKLNDAELNNLHKFLYLIDTLSDEEIIFEEAYEEQLLHRAISNYGKPLNAQELIHRIACHQQHWKRIVVDNQYLLYSDIDPEILFQYYINEYLQDFFKSYNLDHNYYEIFSRLNGAMYDLIMTTPS